MPVVEVPDVPVLCNVVCSTRERALATPRAHEALGAAKLGCFLSAAFDADQVRGHPFLT